MPRIGGQAAAARRDQLNCLHSVRCVSSEENQDHLLQSGLISSRGHLLCETHTKVWLAGEGELLSFRGAKHGRNPASIICLRQVKSSQTAK